ncbi:transcription termination factor 2, mitochondrial [Rhinophrynus dorsalis]
MLKGIVHKVLIQHSVLRATCYTYKQIGSSWIAWSIKSRTSSSLHTDTDITRSSEENKRTVESLYKLCVNIKKIRQLKSWVLSKDVAYVEETAHILKDLGADDITVANILERCPEAFLQDPTETNAQRYLWNLVCPNNEELVKIISRFPDSFFNYKCPENQRANIKFFQDLGLSNKIICRLLTTSPQIFCNLVVVNKQIIDVLEENYLSLGGTITNFKAWLMKLLSQDPFILSKSPLSIKENLTFIQSLGFTDGEMLKLLSRLKGFIFDLSCVSMEKSVLFSKSIFESENGELRQLILKCPGLLYYTVPVLEDRIKCLLKEGASINQIKECPNVLELTTQIIEFRIKKIKLLGQDIKGQNLDILNGTKKDFEVNYGKLHVKRERPLFNPVAPLHVDE